MIQGPPWLTLWLRILWHYWLGLTCWNSPPPGWDSRSISLILVYFSGGYYGAFPLVSHALNIWSLKPTVSFLWTFPVRSICIQSSTRLRNSSQIKGSGICASRFLKSLTKDRIFPAGQYSKKSVYRFRCLVCSEPRSADPRNNPTLKKHWIWILIFCLAPSGLMRRRETESNRLTTNFYYN